VKCDEKKPFCSRCIRFKTQCAGYPNPRANQPPRQPLLPKSAEMEVILRCPVTTQLFDSEQDLRYFRIFCQETAHQISGPFNTGLWNRLMPQASEAVPFVRHAIIAVAALSKITGEADHTLMIRGEGKESSRLRLEHRYALQ
jgi:Fungal Zn(2)-Cys(6) binuclear cluster domain